MPWPKGRQAGNATVDDDQFVRLFSTLGAQKTARHLGINVRNIHSRRRRIEDKQNAIITAPTKGGHVQHLDQHPASIQVYIKDGIVLVGSDAHFWPGIHSSAYRAFVKFCQTMNPAAVIMNGDAYDGARVSRWPDGSWTDMSNKPSVIQELEATGYALSEIAKAAPKARHLFPLGNHDARFEMRLLQQVPEYANVHGTKLKDHFPEWESCWAVLINKDVVVKHRYKSGIHAPHNNAMWSGRTMLTGHLHSLKVQPISDYNGTRWGVDTGTLADPYGPQFYNYTELNPLNWRAGFAVLTFKDGKLLWPETVWAHAPDAVQWRGEVIPV
jgi:hypothetical protein